jgi:hypothetical protein
MILSHRLDVEHAGRTRWNQRALAGLNGLVVLARG